MAVEKVDIKTFLELAKIHPVLDARSPAEFAHARFPGAFNLPLFSDEERKVVGTAYKQQGRRAAIKIGLGYFGTRMREMVEIVENLLKSREEAQLLNTTGIVLAHCWRGGMRSAAVAWLLDIYGFKVYLLEGGYKNFRHYVLETFKIPCSFLILGGYTGSAKTYILHEWLQQGVKVIDLEGLANHKGSAFGEVGKQPSQEMFENLVACQLRACIEQPSGIAGDKIWLEDESQRIGSVIIPQDFWEQMRHSPVCFLEVPFNERLEHIVIEYGGGAREKLADSIIRIQKRLGGLETKNAVRYLQENNLVECFKILLTYYDKCYLKSFESRVDSLSHIKISCETVAANVNALKILDYLSYKPASV
ncbi:MAG: tRNA 2-selenouridine(34) synthase MnmH [Chitinophagaceae bacterium]